MVVEQKILVANKEPNRNSIKAKVNPKTKTNHALKKDFNEGFKSTITKKQEKIDKFKDTVK